MPSLARSHGQKILPDSSLGAMTGKLLSRKGGPFRPVFMALFKFTDQGVHEGGKKARKLHITGVKR